MLALEMSRPVSTIVVQTSTSNRFSQKSTMTCSSWCSPIWPCATAIRASGTSSREPGRGPLDRLDPVVHVEDLALAQQLAPDRGGDLLLVVGADERQDRVPLLRRRRERRHLADAGDRHLERARDRRRAHREDVDVGPQLLELLLVLDAEALLLVDDDQAEVLEPHLAREQPVGADDDVDGAVAQALERRRRPRCRSGSGTAASPSTGKPAYRSANVSRCCCTSSVVGTSIATCLPSCTALNAARTAISVLP